MYLLLMYYSALCISDHLSFVSRLERDTAGVVRSAPDSTDAVSSNLYVYSSWSHVIYNKCLQDVKLSICFLILL